MAEHKLKHADKLSRDFKNNYYLSEVDIAMAVQYLRNKYPELDEKGVSDSELKVPAMEVLGMDTTQPVVETLNSTHRTMFCNKIHTGVLYRGVAKDASEVAKYAELMGGHSTGNSSSNFNTVFTIDDTLLNESFGKEGL